jgi:hypothetical protein
MADYTLAGDTLRDIYPDVVHYLKDIQNRNPYAREKTFVERNC